MIAAMRNLEHTVVTIVLTWLIKASVGIARYRRVYVGGCRIMVPARRLNVINSGLAYLKQIDSKMYEAVSERHGLIIWYYKGPCLRCGRAFSIPEDLLLWGNEGVALFFAQTIIRLDTEHLPFKDAVTATSARRLTMKRLVTWISRQNFTPELVRQCEDIAGEVN